MLVGTKHASAEMLEAIFTHAGSNMPGYMLMAALRRRRVLDMHAGCTSASCCAWHGSAATRVTVAAGRGVG